MKRYSAIILLALLILPCCENFIRRPLEISGCCPADGTICNPEELEIYITFDREPDKLRTRDAFSITTGGEEPPGRVSWDGNKLLFSPYQHLQPDADFFMKVSTAAEDGWGNSLTEDFQVSFRTGEEGLKPSVVSVSPAAFTEVSEQLIPIIIVFDQPMDKASLLDGFSISPSAIGVTVLSSDGKKFTFTPAENLKWQKDYSLTISAKARSAKGISLGEDYSWNFRMGTDSSRPELVSAESEDSTVILHPSPAENPAITINGGWEKHRNIRFIFSEEVEKQGAESAVNIEPAVPFSVCWDDKSFPAEMIIKWDDGLEWKKLYRINLTSGISDLQGNTIENESVYHIFVDGPQSKPPVLVKVDFIPDQSAAVRMFDRDIPANGTDSSRILDTSGGDATQPLFYLDYYFTLAGGAQLPFFGLIENYNINPGESCISITYLNFQLYNPGVSTAAAADPKPAPTADQAVVRLICSVTDSKTASGTIVFQVFKDLIDSLGNKMESDWRAELFDEDN